MDNQYFEILNSAIQEIVESNGDILITRDPAQSQTKQNTQIMDMLDMGIDLVFLNPVDWKAVTPALIACREKNVPVINVDTNVFCSDCVASIVISDNYDAGVQIGKDIIAKRKAARIVVLNHNGINSTDLRIRGFMDTIEKSSLDYRIVYKGITTSTLVSSMAVMQKFLDRGIGFDVVIGGNDPTALGALAAMQKKHIETRHILLYGIDGSPASKIMIQEGYMEGTAAQFPQIMGKKAAEIAYDYLSGRKIKSIVYIPVKLITRKNIERFDVLDWQ